MEYRRVGSVAFYLLHKRHKQIALRPMQCRIMKIINITHLSKLLSS